MAVKIRLTRMGKKKQPSYRVVVMDSRKPRDGAYIEQIGRYDPRQDPSIVEIDNDRALDWLSKGAQPTDRVRKLLEISGAWTRFRVSKGDIHTVEDTPPPTSAAEPQPEPVVLEEIQAEAAAAEAAVAEAAVAEAAVAEAAVAEPQPEPEPVLLEEIQAEAAAAEAAAAVEEAESATAETEEEV